jgi:hypothetical protein
LDAVQLPVTLRAGRRRQAGNSLVPGCGCGLLTPLPKRAPLAKCVNPVVIDASAGVELTADTLRG